MIHSSILRPLAAAALLLLSSACVGSETVAPPEELEGTLTVDARNGWAFVSLENEAVVTPGTSFGTSTTWDIAFNATAVMLNGGLAGPGGVSGYCICQNATATDAQLLAMTADGELADFGAVTAIPLAAQFSTETLSPAISGWFSGTGASATADPAKTFIVRLNDGTS